PLGSKLVTEQIDPEGVAGRPAGVTFFKYDALARLIRKGQKQSCIGGSCPDTIDLAGDAVAIYAYDPNADVTSITEPNGNATTYDYDPLNRRTQETNAANDVTMTEYDGVGNVTRVTAPNGNVTDTFYDVVDRPVNVVDRGGPVVSYTYDFVGN